MKACLHTLSILLTAVVAVARKCPPLPPPGTACSSQTTLTSTATTILSCTVTPEPMSTCTTEVETTTVTVSVTSGEGSTFHTTTTLYTTQAATTTSTVTTSNTATQTSFVTAAAVTVPAPDGLVPIRSEYPLTGPEGGNSQRQRRAGHADHGGHPLLHRRHIAVTPCIWTVWSTATATSTQTYSTTTTLLVELHVSTVTSTVTTSTFVLGIPASTTITASSTSTIITTTTVLATTTTNVTTATTATLPNPTPTFYAACGEDNMLTTFTRDNQPHVISAYSFRQGGTKTVEGPSSAYECCVACLLEADADAGTGRLCGGTAWMVSAGQCVWAGSDLPAPEQGQCRPTRQAVEFAVVPGTVADTIASNGACGVWQNNAQQQR